MSEGDVWKGGIAKKKYRKCMGNGLESGDAKGCKVNGLS